MRIPSSGAKVERGSPARAPEAVATQGFMVGRVANGPPTPQGQAHHPLQGPNAGTGRKAQKRWADYSDEESSRDFLGSPPVMSDDSYVGPALSLLADSKHGLNLAFKGSTGLDSNPPSKRAKIEASTDGRKPDEKKPRDFGSMLRAEASYASAEGDFTEPECEKTKNAQRREDTGKPNELNPFAADFIPTLNPNVQPMAVFQICPNSVATLTGPKTALLPKKKGRSRASSEVGSTCSAGHKHREIPDMTEDEWRNREERRELDILKMKVHVDYTSYLNLVPKDSRCPEEPKTPDRSDKNISKREWKKIVETWRASIKSRVHGNISRCNSTISEILGTGDVDSS